MNGAHLGLLSDGAEFRIPPSQFGFHFAFYGATGGGKTRAAMKLAIEAEHRDIRLLILDVEGEWKNIIPKLNGEVEYYAPYENLRINPYDLNDYGLVRALLKETTFKGVEAEYQDLSPQMNYVLEKCIQMSNTIPSLIDNVISFEDQELPFRLNSLEKSKTALLVRLEPYRSNPVLNEIFYTEASSIDFETLDKKNILIDLHSLEAQVAYRTEMRLIYNAIAVAYLKLALGRAITDEVTNLFIADEAQLLVPKILRKVVATDTHLTTEFSSRLRKRGQSIAIITQSPSNIEDDIRKNCQNVFYFRLQDGKDIELAGKSLGYTWSAALEHFAQALTNLKQKQAIVKTPLIDEPFIVSAPEVSISAVTKDDLVRHMPKIPEGTEFMPVKTLRDELSDEEKAFLNSVESRPFIPTRERRHLLHLTDKSYSKAVKQLIQKGKIERIRVRNGKGAPRILYQAPGTNPGVKHEFYVNWIIGKLREKGVDGVASRTGPDIQIQPMQTAINVETGNSDLRGNIGIALNNFHSVIVCSDDEKLIQSLSRENTNRNVLFCLCWEVPSLIERNRVYAGELTS